VAHFSATPGPYKNLLQIRSDLFLAGSPQIYFLKKCAKRAGSGWPHIFYRGGGGGRGAEKTISLYLNMTFSKFLTFSEMILKI
jgi:hypothetical protein